MATSPFSEASYCKVLVPRPTHKRGRQGVAHDREPVDRATFRGSYGLEPPKSVTVWKIRVPFGSEYRLSQVVNVSHDRGSRRMDEAGVPGPTLYRRCYRRRLAARFAAHLDVEVGRLGLDTIVGFNCFIRLKTPANVLGLSSPPLLVRLFPAAEAHRVVMIVWRIIP